MVLTSKIVAPDCQQLTIPDSPGKRTTDKKRKTWRIMAHNGTGITGINFAQSLDASTASKYNN